MRVWYQYTYELQVLRKTPHRLWQTYLAQNHQLEQEARLCGKKWHPSQARLSHSSLVISSPLIGPGLVSTSPATTSNKDSARERDKSGVAHILPRRPHEQHRTSLPREESVPFPAPHRPVSTLPASESSSRTHNRGISEVTRSKCRCSGTRGRDPQCAWYHRSFLFSHWPILARHSSGPLGGIFKIGFVLAVNSRFANGKVTWIYLQSDVMFWA